MTTALIKGSLKDAMNKSGKSLAQSFLEVDAVIMVDVSASMETPDAGFGKTRYKAACDELERLQNDLPGKIAVCCFSTTANFCASGVPNQPENMTNMVAALKMLKKADGCGIKLILISDGEPNDEIGTLDLAKTFESRIDTVFVGNEMSGGRDFLKKLSDLTGGISIVNETQKLDLLSNNVKLLIAA